MAAAMNPAAAALDNPIRDLLAERAPMNGSAPKPVAAAVTSAARATVAAVGSTAWRMAR